MRYVRVEQTDSTNSFVREHAESLESGTLVWALEQTHGRGQRGNSWEATPGMNVTASLCFRPSGIHARDQFAISEAVALAVSATLRDYGIEARVKWPNDIYVADKKIAGILIENSIMGTDIERSIAGIGLNVNQEEFLSDAPNPVSMRQISGEEYPLEEVVRSLGARLEEYLEKIKGDPEALHGEYKNLLWRGAGSFQYRERESGEEFSARIADVELSGHLVLAAADGSTRRYAFKEVEFLL